MPVAGLIALVGLGFIVTGSILWWRLRKSFAFRLWPARMSRPAILRHHRDMAILLAPLLCLSLVTGAMLNLKPVAELLMSPWTSPTQMRAALAFWVAQVCNESFHASAQIRKCSCEFGHSGGCPGHSFTALLRNRRHSAFPGFHAALAEFCCCTSNGSTGRFYYGPHTAEYRDHFSNHSAATVCARGHTVTAHPARCCGVHSSSGYCAPVLLRFIGRGNVRSGNCCRFALGF